MTYRIARLRARPGPRVCQQKNPRGPAGLCRDASRMRILGAIAVIVALQALGTAAEATNSVGATLTRFNAASESKLTLKGAYSIRDWHAEGTLLCGFLEVMPGFPKLPGTPGRVAQLPARGEVFFPVRNLKAVGESREEYNEQITRRIHHMLRADEHPRIYFWLSQLETGASQPAESPPVFIARGKLAIAGVTNQISLPIAVKRLQSGAIQISGRTTIKQSDFGIIPKPTGFRCFAADPDPVEIAFDWMLKETAKR